MDTSEVYIKMCEKATDIQELWLPSVGDWFLHDYRGTTGFGQLEKTIWKEEVFIRVECLTYKPADDYITVSTIDGSGGVYTSSSLLKDAHVWLPRQDQLQALVIDNYISARKMFVHFGFYNTEYGEINYSPEKLWLCFVMEEKYNKVWDGEDWVGKT